LYHCRQHGGRRLRNDGDEDIAGTAPQDPGSIFRIDACDAAPDATHVVIRWTGRSGRCYDALFTTNLLLGEWYPIPGATNLAGCDAPMILTNVVGDAASAFFSLDVRRE
jgi:hypothetical protein